MTASCSIGECVRPSRIRTLCQHHYDQARNRGTIPMPARQTPPSRGTCSVDDCTTVTASSQKTLCQKHLTRHRRHGDVHVVNFAHWAGDECSYRSAHERVWRQRGPARKHPCVDCGNRAYDWSYRYTAGDRERTTQDGRPYSPNPSDYEPRCRKCHWAFDAPIRQQKRKGT